MASVLPLASAETPPEFVEALGGLIAGITSLDFVRHTLAEALAEDRRVAAVVQSLMDDAYRDGRLGAEEYEILTGDLGHWRGEDVPTEWSEEVAREVTSGGDTAEPDGTTAGDPLRPTLSPGAVLARRYVLQARVMPGGMSEVYKALDRNAEDGRDADPWVAVKLVTPAAGRVSEVLLLENEAALAHELNHPHIVRVRGFERDGDHAFVTMEWLDGEPLAELLTRQRFRPLTLAHARQIMVEIGDALAYAHARGIVHADVKPGNIFLLRDGHAKLLDFGIANSAADVTERPGSRARTVAYSSCEVLEGEAATAQDDVFSLACVAYRMLAGRRAFGQDDALAAEATGRRPAPIRTLSETQWAALERALALCRDARTPDMATFLRDFDRRAPARQPETPAASADEAPAQPASWRRWASIAAALIATTVIGIWRWPVPGPPAAPVVRVELPAPAPAQAPATETAPPAPPAPAIEPPPKKNIPAREARQSAPPAMPETRVESPPEAPSPPPVEAASEPVAVLAPIAAVAAATVPEAAPVPTTVADTRAAPAPVPLSSLKFTRYVEPQDYRRAIEVAGWVELSFTVDADGRTRDIAVVRASPPERYVEIAVAAVKRWRFEPAREPRRTDVRIRFEP